MLQPTKTIDTSRDRFIDPATALLLAIPLAFILKDDSKALTAIAFLLTALLGLEALSWLFDRSAKKTAEAMSLEQLFAASKVDLTPIDYSMPAAPVVEDDSAEHEAKISAIFANAAVEATELGKQYRERALASFLSQVGTTNGSPPQGSPAALHA